MVSANGVNSEEKKNIIRQWGWLYEDPYGLLEQRISAIFISRQSRKIDPQRPWVRALKSLLQWQTAQTNERIWLVTEGLLAHNVISIAVSSQFPVIHLCPKKPALVEGSRRGWSHSSATPLGFLFPRKPLSRIDFFSQRDALMALLASEYFFLHIRPGGTMEHLARRALKEAIPVYLFLTETFQDNEALVRSLNHRGAITLPTSAVETSLKAEAAQGEETERPLTLLEPTIEQQRQYLWHYTRACPGPWPDQSWDAYVRSLLQGEPEAAHSAFHTLCHILNTGVIRASGALIRGSIPVVSFTEIPPHRFGDMQRYNTALARWTVEPYGIGIRRAAAMAYGCKPVIYGTREDFDTLPETDKFRFQRRKSDVYEWEKEKEWRIGHNVTLGAFDADDILIALGRLSDSLKLSRKVRAEMKCVICHD